MSYQPPASTNWRPNEKGAESRGIPRLWWVNCNPVHAASAASLCYTGAIYTARYHLLPLRFTSRSDSPLDL